MEISRFFNSAPGDPRTYQASDFASYFGDVLSSGLLHTDNLPALEVKVDGADLRTYVTPGKAIIQGYGYQNTSNLYLTHALPEATLDRIDRIVMRLDKRNQSRFIKLFVKQGTAAASPVPPALQKDEFIHELSLAQIRVRANTSTLQASDLIDERLDEDLCGLVYSLISIPTSQFQAEWDAFMAGIQDSGFASAEELSSHLAEQASKTEYGHVMVGDGLSVINGVISADIPELEATNVTTAQGTTVQSEIDTLKSSVSNGKVSVRDAITGRGGTVSDADGDGISSFSELQAGVNTIPKGEGILIPHASNLASHKISEVDSEGNRYYVYSVSPYDKARVYDKNHNLLKELTAPTAQPIRSVSKKYFTADDSGAGFVDLFNHSLTKLQTIQASATRTKRGAIREGQYAYDTGTGNNLRVVDWQGNSLWSQFSDNAKSVFLNKKENFVFIHTAGTSSSYPMHLYKYAKDGTAASLLNVMEMYYGLDLINW